MEDDFPLPARAEIARLKTSSWRLVGGLAVSVVTSPVGVGVITWLIVVALSTLRLVEVARLRRQFPESWSLLRTANSRFWIVILSPLWLLVLAVVVAVLVLALEKLS